MTFDEILTEVSKLSKVDKLRLIEFLAKSIREEMEAQERDRPEKDKPMS
jgi:hypothetical protein